LLPSFDSTATYSDGSCQMFLGCTDEAAINYRSVANVDDGRCIYAGCMESTAANYDPSATLAAECISPIYGCTNSFATNYRSLANVDDGSCVYGGCIDTASSNYDSSATFDDGSCLPYFYGCTESNADNYASIATIDDRSCVYSSQRSVNSAPPPAPCFQFHLQVFVNNQTSFLIQMRPASPTTLLRSTLVELKLDLPFEMTVLELRGGSAEVVSFDSSPAHVIVRVYILDTSISVSLLCSKPLGSMNPEASDISVACLVPQVSPPTMQPPLAFAASFRVEVIVTMAEYVSGIDLSIAEIVSGAVGSRISQAAQLVDSSAAIERASEIVFANGSALNSSASATLLTVVGTSVCQKLETKGANSCSMRRQPTRVRRLLSNSDEILTADLIVFWPHDAEVLSCADLLAAFPETALGSETCLPKSTKLVMSFHYRYSTSVGVNELLPNSSTLSEFLQKKVAEYGLVAEVVAALSKAPSLPPAMSEGLPPAPVNQNFGLVQGCGDSTAVNYASDVTQHVAADCQFAATASVGCMAPTALNYDRTATGHSPQSCAFAVEGCMDSRASNYASDSTTQPDGACEYRMRVLPLKQALPLLAAGVPVIPSGCTWSWATNYESNAVLYDGSCIWRRFGCTDSFALNYATDATNDDGSCIPFATGCMAPSASNFDTAATRDDGSCHSFRPPPSSPPPRVPPPPSSPSPPFSPPDQPSRPPSPPPAAPPACTWRPQLEICRGLTADYSATDAVACASSCCADPDCFVWQFSASSAAAVSGTCNRGRGTSCETGVYVSSGGRRPDLVEDTADEVNMDSEAAPTFLVPTLIACGAAVLLFCCAVAVWLRYRRQAQKVRPSAISVHMVRPSMRRARRVQAAQTDRWPTAPRASAEEQPAAAVRNILGRPTLAVSGIPNASAPAVERYAVDSPLPRSLRRRQTPPKHAVRPVDQTSFVEAKMTSVRESATAALNLDGDKPRKRSSLNEGGFQGALAPPPRAEPSLGVVAKSEPDWLDGELARREANALRLQRAVRDRKSRDEAQLETLLDVMRSAVGDAARESRTGTHADLQLEQSSTTDSVQMEPIDHLEFTSGNENKNVDAQLIGLKIRDTNIRSPEEHVQTWIAAARTSKLGNPSTEDVADGTTSELQRALIAEANGS